MRIVRLMNSTAGRGARVVLGLALIGAGAATGGAGGIALALIGLVPIGAGTARTCLAAPLLHAPMRAR